MKDDMRERERVSEWDRNRTRERLERDKIKRYRENTRREGNKEKEEQRDRVTDPYGNRIETLGKRNFSSGASSGRSARLEIRQRNSGTPYAAPWRFPPRLATTCRASRSISANCGAGLGNWTASRNNNKRYVSRAEPLPPSLPPSWIKQANVNATTSPEMRI